MDGSFIGSDDQIHLYIFLFILYCIHAVVRFYITGNFTFKAELLGHGVLDYCLMNYACDCKVQMKLVFTEAMCVIWISSTRHMKWKVTRLDDQFVHVQVHGSPAIENRERKPKQKVRATVVREISTTQSGSILSFTMRRISHLECQCAHI